MKKEENAYMTVEASLVMSLVLMLYLFIIEYALWGYDRYMTDRDLAVILIHCANAEEIESVWQREKRIWEEKEYLWVGSKETTLEKGLLTLKITGEASGGSLGNIKSGYEMWDLKPQQWLRGKVKLSDKEEEGDKGK